MRGMITPCGRWSVRAAVIAGMAIVASQAHTQQTTILKCQPTAALAERLSGVGETRVWRGLAQQGQLLIELWLSPNGTWSIVVVAPTGVSCVSLHGLASAMRRGP